MKKSGRARKRKNNYLYSKVLLLFVEPTGTKTQVESHSRPLVLSHPRAFSLPLVDSGSWWSWWSGWVFPLLVSEDFLTIN